MNIFFPILAAILQAGSFTLDKFALSIKRVSFKTYTGASFPLVFLVTLIVFLVFRPSFTPELFHGRFLWLLIAGGTMTIGTNFIFYRALDHDLLEELNTIDLVRNVPIILVASILFADERNLVVLIPALVASLAIVWSHWEHHHFRMHRYTIIFLIWTLITAPLSAAIAKVLLTSWNPIALELVRNGLLAVVFGGLFFKNMERVPHEALKPILYTSILSPLAWIFFYFGYQRLGITYTLLLFTLQPLLVYASSVLILKEPLQTKKTAAFLIVLAAIVVAQWLR